MLALQNGFLLKLESERPREPHPHLEGERPREPTFFDRKLMIS
jgi:hypothetical protein